MNLPTKCDGKTVRFDQISRPLPIVRRQGVPHCLGDQPLLLVPETGAAVKGRRRPGARTARQTVAYHLGEQMMIAIPLPFVIQRHEKQIGALQLIEYELAVCIDDRRPTTDE